MEIKVNTKANRRNLGFGTYGPIVKGYHKDRKVAVKKVPIGELSENVRSVESALLEWGNPHVVKLIFAEEDSEFKYFAFEQCKNSLDQLINSEKRFRTPRYKILSCRKTGKLRPKEMKIAEMPPEKTEQSVSSIFEYRFVTSEIKDKLLNDLDSYKQYKRSKSSMPMPTDESVLLQLAKGLDYIHKQGIAYGSIKPENVLIDDVPKVTLKWADFGLTKLTIPNSDLPIGIRLSSCAGLWTWMAPELLKKIISGQQFTSVNSLGLTTASDIFSAGCLFFYVVTRGTHPFGDLNEAPMNIIKMEASNLEELPQEHSLRELIDNMILENASSRIQLKRVVEVLTDLANRREREIKFLELCTQLEKEEEEMLPLIRYYIDVGVDLNCTDEHGRTPLMLLYLDHSTNSRFRSTELLLGNKKDIPHSPTVKSPAPCAQRRRRMKNIFQQSSRERSPSPMKIAHADVNCTDNTGRNALMYLVTGKKRDHIQETVKLFLWNGIEINHEYENGNNALMYLCSSYKGCDIVELAGMLISYGIDVNHVNVAGDNTLYCLLCNAEVERFDLIENLVEYLVREGIDVNHENKSGQNVLLKLLWDSHPSVEIVKLLIRSGIDLHLQPRQGWDALFYLNKDYTEDEVNDFLVTARKLNIST